MTNAKLQAGATFPSITVTRLGGGTIDLSKPNGGYDWRMVVVYRGKHCPICTRYLSQLNELKPKFNEIGVDIVAVSADPEGKARAQTEPLNLNYEVGYDLSVPQMQQLGLYVSDPRSPEETDRPFAEPGLFVINSEGKAQLIDISNAPFARPDLESMTMGLGFIRNPANNYPIRGMHSA